jgi:hypothetical protein
VAVVFSTPLPSASYAVSLTVTSSATGFADGAAFTCAGNGTTTGCYFFTGSGKTAAGFTVTLRNKSGTATNATPSSVTVDYVAIVNK